MEASRDLNFLKVLFEQPRLYLCKYCDELKNKIDLEFCQKGLLNLEDEEKWSTLINKIESLEVECLNSMPTNEFSSEFSIQTKKSIEYAESNIKNRRKKSKIRKLIKDEQLNIKKNIFSNKTVKFVENYRYKDFDEFYENFEFKFRSFLLILHDAYLPSNFIRSSLEKLQTYSMCILGSYFKSEELAVTSDLLKIIIIEKFLNQTMNCHMNLVEINLKIINRLDLSHANITTIESNSFHGLANLINLNLSHNKIDLIHSSTFSGLSNLEILNLTYNKISSIKSDDFAEITNLKDLKISIAKVNLLIVEAFKQINSLEKLTLIFRNPMVIINLTTFVETKSLEEIFSAWKLMRHFNKEENVVLLSDRIDKANKPLQLEWKTEENESYQIMSLKDGKREFLLRSKDKFIVNNEMESRLNELRLYEANLKNDAEASSMRDIEQFFNNFDL